MRAFITSAILTVATLTVNVAPAAAQTGGLAGLVDSWYVRYLGRHADPLAMSDQLRAIRAGTPLDLLEASVLRSDEYYFRNGGTPEAFVAALHRDVLGRRAGPREFALHVHQVLREGRNAAALSVLAERNPPVIVARPAPVIVTRPVYVEPAVIVPHHRHHHYGPAYVAPRPGVSIRVGIR